jgi:hypothetical protein
MNLATDNAAEGPRSRSDRLQEKKQAKKTAPSFSPFNVLTHGEKLEFFGIPTNSGGQGGEERGNRCLDESMRFPPPRANFRGLHMEGLT